MKTAIVNSIRKSITFKCHTGMYTQYTSPLGKSSQFGANIYTVDDSDEKVLVGTSHRGEEMTGTVKVISAEEYAVIADLDDAYNNTAYHDAVMTALGFK